MPREGRFLEVLVKHLEQFLSSEGIVVTSPEEFYEQGVKIGEIDVTLRGDFGSSRVFIGLECRDRPSEGPQGVAWINEIIGKKVRLNVDKMVAVSSTGFTEPAINAADRHGIDLMTVEDAAQFNPSEWFQTMVFSSNDALVKIVGTPRITTVPPIPKRNLLLKPDTPFLRLPGSTGLISLKDHLQPEIDALSAVFEHDFDVEEVQDTIRVNRPAYAVLEEGEFTVTELVIPVKLRRKVHQVKLLLNVYRRLRDGDIVALSGICEFETGGRKVKMLVLVKKNVVNGVLLGGEMEVRFLTEDNEPDEGMRLDGIAFYRQGDLVSFRKITHNEV